MKKLVVVVLVNLMYAFSSSAQSTTAGENNNGNPSKTNSGLLKLKPGEHISSENKSSANDKSSATNELKTVHAQDYNNPDFQVYLQKVNGQIANNDRSISELKSVLWGKDTKTFHKEIKLVTSLEKENEELKTDLDNYIHYGMGSWKVFQKEFNQDLMALTSDLSILDQMYIPGDLISSNTK